MQLSQWPEQVKTMQKNWIGRSEGAHVSFAVEAAGAAPPPVHHVEVFTTRIDTLFGVSYVAISRDHPLVEYAISMAKASDNAETAASIVEFVKHPSVKVWLCCSLLCRAIGCLSRPYSLLRFRMVAIPLAYLQGSLYCTPSPGRR